MFYDINLTINIVIWFQKLYPSVLFRYQIRQETLVEFCLNLTFRLPTYLTFRLPAPR